MNAELRVVAFDLDDTLTASKSKIDQQMADLLGELLARLEVCIISGGRFEQIQAQVLQYLHAPPGRLAHLHIMPTCLGRRILTRRRGPLSRCQPPAVSAVPRKQVVLRVFATSLTRRVGSQTGHMIDDARDPDDQLVRQSSAGGPFSVYLRRTKPLRQQGPPDPVHL